MDENKENNTTPTEGQNTASEEKPPKKKMRLVTKIILMTLAAFVLVFAILVIRQNVYFKPKYEAPPTPAPTAEIIPDATPEPTPYVKKIPVTMYFTARELICPVEVVGVVPYTDSNGKEVKNANGDTVYTMGTLDTERSAAWLDISASPGEYGNAIFNGHVSWKKTAGVFSVLPKMENGEEIVIEYDDNSTQAFYVSSIEIFGIDEAPDYIMAQDTGDSRITLITCYGGDWNSELGTREQRCVVIAKPLSYIVPPSAEEAN